MVEDASVISAIIETRKAHSPQRIHLARDNPREAADIVLTNETCSRHR
jgi:hypothetical protein